jgi:hypothetical protein
MHKQLAAIITFLWCAVRVQAQCQACELLQDRIVNGDFENGNSGFTSSFEYVTFFPFICTLCPENTYAIGNNATLFHSGFAGSDHTNPPSGDFFIANAPGQEGAEVWCQSVNVLPQTTYTFTFWARDIANNNNPHPLAVLRPSFNGEIVSDSLLASGNWSSFSTTWFSDTLTQLDICILDFQSQTGGNDFGLDDISLTACEPIILSQPAFAGNDTTLCSRDAIELGVNPVNGYTYDWWAVDGLSAANLSNPIFQIDNQTGSTLEYSLLVTRDSAGVGCIASDSITIFVLSMTPLELVADQTICPNDSALLICPGNWDSLIWSTGDTSSSLWTSPGSYDVTVYTGVCSESDTVNVLAFAMPPTNLPEEVTHCNTEALVVEAAVSGQWTGSGFQSENPATILASGTYFFHYSAGSCNDTDTVQVALYDMQEAQLHADTTLCEGTTAVLTSSYAGTWSNGVFSSEITIASAGTYTIEINNGPCISIDTIEVAGRVLPNVALGADTTFCEDYPIELNAWNEGASYLWSTGDTTASILTSGSGLYRVEATNVCGMSADEIRISNFPCSWALYIPSGCTPNEDTFNEGWGVSGYNLKEIDLTIYNRFGDAIFHSTELDALWLPSAGAGDDTYNYRIEVTPFEGSKEVRTGVIYLLR